MMNKETFTNFFRKPGPGLSAPILIALILHIANNKKIMGKFTSSRVSNIFGLLCFILMSIAAFLLMYLLFQAD